MNISTNIPQNISKVSQKYVKIANHGVYPGNGRCTHKLHLSTMSALFDHKAKWNPNYKAGSGILNSMTFPQVIKLASHTGRTAGQKTSRMTNLTNRATEVQEVQRSWEEASVPSGFTLTLTPYVQAGKDLGSVPRSTGQKLEQQLPVWSAQT